MIAWGSGLQGARRDMRLLRHRRKSQDVCHGRMHIIQAERMQFRSPTENELLVGLASASDYEAQYRLGWNATDIVYEPRRSQLLATAPRRGGGIMQFKDAWYLYAVDSHTGRHAGMVSVGCQPHGYEIGGWLAPAFRRLHLGSELFGAALTLAHEHLGIATVVAGTENTNIACRRALETAGFVAIQRAPVHILPNGRITNALWYAHTASTPRQCS